VKIDLETLEVKNNVQSNRFEAKTGGFTAVIEYQLADDVIIFIHTGVPEEISGHGIGSKMTKTALDYARDAGLKVIPQCPFVADFISHHPEYWDLVVNLG
jgi:predicted GNAT family acetyltransferase